MALLAPDAGPVPVRALRWIARAASLVSLGLLGLFAFSGGAWPSASEWLLIVLFPVGVAGGMILAWHREVLGGAITLGCLLGFHVALAVMGDRPWPGPWFIAFALPGIVLLACGLATRGATRR